MKKKVSKTFYNQYNADNGITKKYNFLYNITEKLVPLHYKIKNN